MSIRVHDGGLQTTVQERPRYGFRHFGVPASGPADTLAMALANRLVDKPALATALEIAITGPTLEFTSACSIAITGGTVQVRLNDRAVEMHTRISIAGGDVLRIGSVESGVRCYLAVAGDIGADRFLDSASTYLPAALGGFEGRALAPGDELPLGNLRVLAAPMRTPRKFRLERYDPPVLRMVPSAETGWLADDALFERAFTVGRRADRMGIALEGEPLSLDVPRQLGSAPVFPGTLQCPGDGTPFLLGIDAQTTGGYPRVGQVARLDRHRIGQLRPGQTIRFAARSADQAAEELAEKRRAWSEWLADVAEIL